MKKYLLLSATIIMSSLVISANAQSKFSLGPNAGIGGSWTSNTDNSKTKLAGNAGLSLVYSATEHFGIGVDAKYSFEGVKVKTPTKDISLDLDYIRIPLKAIYFFNGYGDKLRPKIAVGPSFGFLTSAKSDEVSASEQSTDVTKNFNRFDFGVLGSAGLNYKLVKNTWLNLDVSYLQGISEIRKYRPESNERNSNFGINVGVNFGL